GLRRLRGGGQPVPRARAPTNSGVRTGRVFRRRRIRPRRTRRRAGRKRGSGALAHRRRRRGLDGEVADEPARLAEQVADQRNAAAGATADGRRAGGAHGYKSLTFGGRRMSDFQDTPPAADATAETSTGDAWESGVTERAQERLAEE